MNIDMKKTILFTIAVFFTLGSVLAQTPSTMWKDNADTQWYNAQDTEFTLNTSSELAGLSVLVAGGNDFSGKTILIDSDLDLGTHLWTPIGPSQDTTFSGTLNGNGHIISNLYVERPGENYAGLLGRCTNADLLNITIENTLITGEDSVGSLVGNAWNSVTITNCHATGVTIDATGDNIGGLVGDLVKESSMHRCSSKGAVNGNSQVGGLLGSPYNGNVITECFSVGMVSANHIAGGLIGASVVGFPGTTETVIENCYSRANVSVVNGYAGGFCGNFASLLIVKNSYSTGTATGPEYDGGFIGGAGAVAGENNYWDTITSQHSNAVGGWPQGNPGSPDITGESTTEMKTSTMVDNLNNGNGPWGIDPNINDGYPSFVSGSVGLPSEKLTKIGLKVYPNVFDAELQLESKAQLKSYTLYESAGKVVQKGELKGNHAIITMQTIDSGLYFILVKTDGGTVSKKIIRQ